MIPPSCKVARGKLAKQFEPSLKVFNQVIENERVDHFVLPDSFNPLRHRLVEVVYARYERRRGV
jgi:hypothetical protein